MMNRFLGFSSLGLAALALAVALWGSQEVTVSVPPTEAPGSDSSQEVQALERRVKTLEETVVHLSSRLMALERRPAAAQDGGAVAVAPPMGLAQEVEQLRAEVRGMVAGEALHSEGGREYLKEVMRSIEEEQRTAQRQERQQQWVQAQTQALAERTQRWRQFASEARLDYSQEQQLMRRLEGEEARRKALMDEVSAGGKSPRDVRRELRTLSNQTDEEMQKLLSQEQYAQYRELRREDRGPQRQGGQGGRGAEGQP
jgi:polyhydroxyalkanoate synthesis regulator phasin